MKKSNFFYSVMAGLVLAVGLPSHAQSCRLVIDENFNNRTGNFVNYTIDMLRSDFNGVNSRAAGEVRGFDGDGKSFLANTTAGNGTLRANYPANIAGGTNSGFLFDKMFEPTEEAVMEYRVMFEGTGPRNEFVWAAGGKLPGLGGTALNPGMIPVGCTTDRNSIENGFSARLMWRRNGELVVYTYFPDRTSSCGVDYLFFTARPNVWYTIRQHIKLNTPGQRNGILEMFVDGRQVMNKRDVLYRNAGKSNVFINDAIFHTYRGGKPDDNRFFS
ncbi:MAG: hypothetical protein MUF42_03585, partial [Cytophagaceae bacterium]|nr:hypothetical protein [Cytophagaceae bacterium]